MRLYLQHTSFSHGKPLSVHTFTPSVLICFPLRLKITPTFVSELDGMSFETSNRLEVSTGFNSSRAVRKHKSIDYR